MNALQIRRGVFLRRDSQLAAERARARDALAREIPLVGIRPRAV
jgi:hypothetical protein